MTDVDATDFAVVVYREDESWEADVLPVALTEDLAGLIHALRQQPSPAARSGWSRSATTSSSRSACSGTT